MSIAAKCTCGHYPTRICGTFEGCKNINIMINQEKDEILGRKLPDSAVAKRIEEMNAPMTPSSPFGNHIHIPLEGGGTLTVSPDASPELIAALHRMVELAKNNTMRWVNLTEEGFPTEIETYYIVEWADSRIAPPRPIYFSGEESQSKWHAQVSHWLDESADQDEIESLRSQLVQEKNNFDRVVGENIRLETQLTAAREEAADYRKGIKAIVEAEGDHSMQCAWVEINDILDKYPAK